MRAVLTGFGEIDPTVTDHCRALREGMSGEDKCGNFAGATGLSLPTASRRRSGAEMPDRPKRGVGWYCAWWRHLDTDARSSRATRSTRWRTIDTPEITSGWDPVGEQASFARQVPVRFGASRIPTTIPRRARILGVFSIDVSPVPDQLSQGIWFWAELARQVENANLHTCRRWVPGWYEQEADDLTNDEILHYEPKKRFRVVRGTWSRRSRPCPLLPLNSEKSWRRDRPRAGRYRVRMEEAWRTGPIRSRRDRCERRSPGRLRHRSPLCI